MRLIFAGPPGGGKGTQAKRLLADVNAVQLSTGDALRAAVAAGTEAGRKAQALMSQGALVPDEIVNEVIEDLIRSLGPDEGWILDGYPRTAEQAEALDALLSELDLSIDKTVLIDVPFTAIEERVLGRRTCRDCQASYHVTFNPPRNAEGRCDECGGELIQRSDDSAATLKTRLDAYSSKTVPVLDYYGQKGVLARVEAGTSGPDEVESLVRKAIGLAA
jgi:adenylate kinase